MIYALKVIYIYHSPVVETLFMVLLCISLQLRDIMLVGVGGSIYATEIGKCYRSETDSLLC